MRRKASYFLIPACSFCSAVQLDTYLTRLISTMVNGGVCIDLLKSYDNQLVYACIVSTVKFFFLKKRKNTYLLTGYLSKNKVYKTLPHNTITKSSFPCSPWLLIKIFNVHHCSACGVLWPLCTEHLWLLFFFKPSSRICYQTKSLLRHGSKASIGMFWLAEAKHL